MRVVAARSCLAVEPWHSLEIVVDHVGRRGGEDLERALAAAAEIRDKDFDCRFRRSFSDCRNTIDEVLRAAVFQVVAIHAGDDDVRQLEMRDGFGEMARLRRIGGERTAMRHVAERAAAGADVAEDHEGGRALAEALGDVGAGGFLANGVQLLIPEYFFYLVKAGARHRRTHADPGRLCERRTRDDLYGNARGLACALFLDAGL